MTTPSVPERRRTLAGFAQGMITMRDDFNEPVDLAESFRAQERDAFKLHAEMAESERVQAIAPLRALVERLTAFRREIAAVVGFVDPDIGPQTVNDGVIADAVRALSAERDRLQRENKTLREERRLMRHSCEQGRKRCENFLRGLNQRGPVAAIMMSVQADFDEALVAADAVLGDDERREQLQSAERRGDNEFLDRELAKAQLSPDDVERIGRTGTPISEWPNDANDEGKG